MLDLKPKQKLVVDAVRSRLFHTIVLIGSVGTGKTDIAAHIAISLCDKYPKTYFPVFRQNITTAKKSVIPSYLNMLEMMRYVEGRDYSYNKSDFKITFLKTGSEIVFTEADVTKDRQGRKIKGMNATANHIDEADELDQTLFVTAMSRRGRRNNYHQPSISIITMNPNDTHLKEKYYTPWKKGTLAKGILVVEFTIEDSWQSKEDVEAMLTNPKPWVERYINNNWDYQDDRSSLFKYRYFDQALTNTLDPNAKRFGGYDVARDIGGDRSVQAMWYGRTLVSIDVFKDKEEEMTTDAQALELIKYMTQNAIVAQNQAVDGVGVGIGVIDHMGSKGIRVKSFKSGFAATIDGYADLRSQVIWEFAQGLEKGTIKIYEGCPFRNELIAEAMAHLHYIDGKKLKVESKEEIKKRTGQLSPDIFDAVIMGLYPQLSLDRETAITRVGF